MPTKKAPAAKKVAENNSTQKPEYSEAAAMQAEIKTQLKMMLKLAAKNGIDINELYEKPPSETVSGISQSDLTAAISTAVKEAVWATKEVLGGKAQGIPMDAYGKPIDAANLPPGTALPGGNFVRWRYEDIGSGKDVTFTPLPVPGLTWPIADEFGRQKLKLDINGLVQWVTVGETCTIKEFFYNQYETAYKQWQETEHFKRSGPAGAAWQEWKYIPFAPSFGMTAEGRSLRVGPPTILDIIPGETAEVPTNNPLGEEK